MDVLIRRKIIKDIPILELTDAAGGTHPLIILIHGYLNRKDFMLNQAYFLASQGFAVIVPDAWGHGERSTGGYPDFFTSVLKTADEIDALIGHYRGDPLADAARAGLTGYSMGGCVVYEYCARQGRQIKAAVPFIATPDWVAVMSSPGTAHEFMKSGVLVNTAGMAPLVAVAERVQPLNRLENFADLPLLMLNGADDPLMPAASLERFCEAILPIYKNRDDIRLSIHACVGHSDTVDMNIQMAAWFLKYL